VVTCLRFGLVRSLAKHFLGIGSPSKVFHEIGMNLGRGLANGIDASAGMAMSASARLAATAIPAVSFNPFTGGANAAGGGGAIGGLSGGSISGAAGAAGGSPAGGTNVTVHVHVEGNVITERNLAVAIQHHLVDLKRNGAVIGLT